MKWCIWEKNKLPELFTPKAIHRTLDAVKTSENFLSFIHKRKYKTVLPKNLVFKGPFENKDYSFYVTCYLSEKYNENNTWEISLPDNSTLQVVNHVFVLKYAYPQNTVPLDAPTLDSIVDSITPEEVVQLFTLKDLKSKKNVQSTQLSNTVNDPDDPEDVEDDDQDEDELEDDAEDDPENPDDIPVEEDSESDEENSCDEDDANPDISQNINPDDSKPPTLKSTKKTPKAKKSILKLPVVKQEDLLFQEEVIPDVPEDTDNILVYEDYTYDAPHIPLYVT